MENMEECAVIIHDATIPSIYTERQPRNPTNLTKVLQTNIAKLQKHLTLVNFA